MIREEWIMRLATTFLALLLVAGCASTGWVKPGGTVADFQRDPAGDVFEDSRVIPAAW
jgi:hypothetical protein